MKIIPAIVLVLASYMSYAQYGDNYSCKCCNSALKVLLEGKIVNKIYVHACNGTGSSDLATSFLMPSGTPPKIVQPKDEPPDYSVLEAWTCKYAPGLVTDGDTKTAWVEGAKDYGVGELIIVSCLDLKKPLQIWSGYGKSPTIFTQNSRPKKIKTMIIRGDTPGRTQYGTYYEHLQVIKQMDIELKDINGFQSLTIPSYTVSKYDDSNQNQMEYDYFLGIVIVDVYKGTKYSDTCISEIKN